MPLRARAISAGILGSLVVFGLGTELGAWLGFGAAYPWTAFAVLVVLLAVVARFLADHPFPRLGPANQVTLVRAGLVALVAGLVGESPVPGVGVAALCGTTVALVLDGVDGWLARRCRVASDFGARFDMETDALLVLVLSALVWHHGKAGVWVLACGLMRYAFVTAGWFLPWMSRQLRPTFRGKAVCVGQIIGLSVALAPVVATPISTVVATLTLAVLSWSFVVDVSWLWRTHGLSASREGLGVT